MKAKRPHPGYGREKANEKTMELLYWEEDYAWIKDSLRFMADLSRNNTLHWCRRCIGHFDTEDVIKTHSLYCRGLDTTGEVLPLPDDFRKVKDENEPYEHTPLIHF